MSQPHPRVAIIGGGPGGYEAALVAAQLGARVTVFEPGGLGGACVLTDCVPSKTLIATAGMMAGLERSASLGIGLRFVPPAPARAAGMAGLAGHAGVDAPRLYDRIRALARAQSADVAARLAAEGVEVVTASGRLAGPRLVAAGDTVLRADVILIATGARPRVLAGAEPDGSRLLDCRQLYDLPDLPAELVVVGSGITGAEFAGAYQALGSQVTLVSSRARVLPNEDADAAGVVEDVFRRRGMTVLSRSRAAAATVVTDRVEISLEAGQTVRGSHCLMAVGMAPATGGLGLAEAGIRTDDRGFIGVDKMSRTSAPGVYAAGDCTGVWMLASVAAMQGRIAMWHALGEAVQPLRLSHVASTIFTDPEIASVGMTERQAGQEAVPPRTVKLPLATNARAKMQGFGEGFVKLFARRHSGIVLGGVIVAPQASELILAVSLAVEQQLTVDQIAHTFAVYPSLSGSVTEAARQLMQPEGSER